MDDNYIRDRLKGGRIVATVFPVELFFATFRRRKYKHISFYAHLPVYIGFFNVLSDWIMNQLIRKTPRDSRDLSNVHQPAGLGSHSAEISGP